MRKEIVEVIELLKEQTGPAWEAILRSHRVGAWVEIFWATALLIFAAVLCLIAKRVFDDCGWEDPSVTVPVLFAFFAIVIVIVLSSDFISFYLEPEGYVIRRLISAI